MSLICTWHIGIIGNGSAVRALRLGNGPRRLAQHRFAASVGRVAAPLLMVGHGRILRVENEQFRGEGASRSCRPPITGRCGTARRAGVPGESRWVAFNELRAICRSHRRPLHRWACPAQETLPFRPVVRTWSVTISKPFGFTRRGVDRSLHFHNWK